MKSFTFTFLLLWVPYGFAIEIFASATKNVTILDGQFIAFTASASKWISWTVSSQQSVDVLAYRMSAWEELQQLIVEKSNNVYQLNNPTTIRTDFTAERVSDLSTSLVEKVVPEEDILVLFDNTLLGDHSPAGSTWVFYTIRREASDMDKAKIIGGIIGGVVGLAVLCLLVCRCLNKQRWPGRGDKAAAQKSKKKSWFSTTSKEKWDKAIEGIKL